jgi:endonuclease/exonuclease/phosphatase family metal-dependent hydrolase
MRYWLSFFLLFLSFSLYAQESTIRLKVLSYNIRFGELASLEELAEFIKQEDPDLVALQEVDCRTFRDRAPAQHGKDFMTELGFYTGMIPAYGKTILYAGGYYGIGILSRFPLAKVERVYLPLTEQGKEQRALLIAEVEYEENQYLTFASTHLDYVNTEVRQAQVKKLNEELQSQSYPVIVAGDFNARPEHTEIVEGMKAWGRLCNMNPTSPAHAPKYKIDYIFGYPENSWKAIDAKTYSSDLSDHSPISVVVELTGK